MFIVGFKRELVCNLNFTTIENQFKKNHLGDSVVACQSVSQSVNHVKVVSRAVQGNRSKYEGYNKLVRKCYKVKLKPDGE